MYKHHKWAVVIPAYNEEVLIATTLRSVPDYVDYIITINDGSKDKTFEIMESLKEEMGERLIIINNSSNLGLGASMVHGYKRALKTDADLISIMPGDAQCDPSYLPKMATELIESGIDYIKANRFVNLKELERMPRFRRIGNIFITLLTKFATGYYSIFDTQNSFGVMRRSVLERMPFELIGSRYEFENTQLIAMSITNVRIKDYPVPAIYGEETSTINVLPTAVRVLHSLWKGFWKRIYYKYILINFHPIALFLFSGTLSFTLGLVYGIYLIMVKIIEGLSPSSGTVMIAVLPLFLGFQLLLTALILDVINEGK